MFIVQTAGVDAWFLARGNWTGQLLHAMHFPTAEIAQAALDSARGYTPPTVWKRAQIVELIAMPPAPG